MSARFLNFIENPPALKYFRVQRIDARSRKALTPSATESHQRVGPTGTDISVMAEARIVVNCISII